MEDEIRRVQGRYASANYVAGERPRILLCGSPDAWEDLRTRTQDQCFDYEVILKSSCEVRMPQSNNISVQPQV